MYIYERTFLRIKSNKKTIKSSSNSSLSNKFAIRSYKLFNKPKQFENVNIRIILRRILYVSPKSYNNTFLRAMVTS